MKIRPDDRREAYLCVAQSLQADIDAGCIGACAEHDTFDEVCKRCKAVNLFIGQVADRMYARARKGGR